MKMTYYVIQAPNLVEYVCGKAQQQWQPNFYYFNKKSSFGSKLVSDLNEVESAILWLVSNER